LGENNIQADALYQKIDKGVNSSSTGEPDYNLIGRNKVQTNHDSNYV